MWLRLVFCFNVFLNNGLNYKNSNGIICIWKHTISKYDDIVKYMMLTHRELDKYNPNRQSKKRSLGNDCPEAVKGSDLSYRTGLINEATRSIRADVVREEEQEQNNDETNKKKNNNDDFDDHGGH